MERHDTVSALLRMVIGPTLWFAHFSFVYALQALLCVTLRTSIAVYAMYATVTLMTVAALAAIAWSDYRTVTTASQSDTSNFQSTIRLALIGLSVVAVLWNSFGVAVLAPCAITQT